MDEVTVLTPTGCIGNRGIHRDAFVEALEETRPDVIAADAGSLDCGPWYLGTGQVHSPMANIHRDLDIVVTGAVQKGIPLIIGSAGGSGGKPHVDLTLEVVKGIAEKRNLDFKVGVVYSDVDKDYLLRRIRGNDPIRKVPTGIFGDLLTEAEVEMCPRIVAMMGVEPIIQALLKGAQVVICGRTADACVMGAYPVMKGFDRGLALHMGDIIECGEMTLTDRQGVTQLLGANRVPVIGTLRSDHFVLKPGHPGMACTIEAVAAHSMYERESHTEVELSGGVIDKSGTVVVQETDSVVRVSGTRYQEKPYSVLLEGAGFVGWRTIAILGARNSRMIEQIDEILEHEKKSMEARYSGSGKLDIYYHVYGKGAVLGPSEPRTSGPVQEMCIVLDIVAETQELAHDVAEDLVLKIAFARYPTRTTTAGNVAYLFSPNVIDVGEAYTTSVYHQLPIEDPLELFPITVRNIREI